MPMSNSESRKRMAEKTELPPQLDHDDYTAAEQRAWFEGRREARTALARVAALADDLERGSSLMWSSTVAKAIREALGGGS